MDFLLFNRALLYYMPVSYNQKYVEWQTECMLTLKMVSKDFAEDCCTFKTISITWWCNALDYNSGITSDSLSFAC